MSNMPNFRGARILGFCLNVMGLELMEDKFHRDTRPLHKAILAWTKNQYVWLHTDRPQVAEACLVDGITFDDEALQLVKTYSANGLEREPSYIRLELEPIKDIGDSTA